MLDIVFNDCFSDLSLVLINGDEEAKILDSGLKVYAEKSFSFSVDPYALIDLWRTALNKYYKQQGDDHLKKWRSTMKRKSLINFKKYIKEVQ